MQGAFRLKYFDRSVELFSRREDRFGSWSIISVPLHKVC